MHGIGDLDEACDVRAADERWELALGAGHVLLGRAQSVMEDILHDVLELGVDLLAGPGDALRVLRHLETGHGDTTGVGRLAGRVPDGLGLLLLAVGLEHVDGILGAAHVGTLGDEARAGGDQGLGLLLGDLVLCGAGKSDVDLDVGPWAGTLDVPVRGGLEGRQCLTLDLEGGDLLDILLREILAGLGDQRTGRVGQGDDGGAELNSLEGGVLGDVSGARDGDGLALEGALSSECDHVIDVIDETVAGGLWSDERSTPASALSGQDSLPLVAVCAVGTEEPSDLASGNTDITSWNIGVGTDVLAQLAHEGDAELADLIVGLSLWIEIGTSLTTTHVD